MKSAQKVPKLRFPEFSGEWQRNELGKITKWSSGGTPAKDNSKYWGGDIPWISAASMYGSTFSSSERTLTELGARSGTKIAKQGSLLLLVRGSMLFNTIPVGIVGRDVAFNQDVKAITSDVLDSKYLLYFFQASEHKLLSKVVGTGIGAGKLDMEDMYSLTVAVPSLDEQQKIAEFLTVVDGRIGLSERRLELLKKYKQGVMQKIFTQQIRLKDANGQPFPKWEIKKLGDVISIENGFPFKSTYFNDQQDGTPLIRIRDLGSETTSAYYSGVYDNRFLVENGDILIGMDGEFNLVRWHAGPALLNQRVMRLRSRPSSSLAYLSYVVETKLKEIEANTPRTTVKHLSNKDIIGIVESVPNLAEQDKIAEFLTALDDKIKLEESKLEQAKNFKKSLLQQMFV